MFKVECPGCHAPYQVDERRVPSSGLKMRCPKCTTSFKVDPPGTGAAGGAVLGAALGGSLPKMAAALGGASSSARRPGITMMGVAPATAPSGAQADLPSVASGGATARGSQSNDLPVAAAPGAGVAKAPPPVPARRAKPAQPAPAGAKDVDLDLPAPAQRSSTAGGQARPRDATSIELDLPAIAALPPPVELPDVRAARPPLRSHPEFELDLPSPSADLPTRGSARPAPGLGASGDLPLPATSLPSPVAGSPRHSAELPTAASQLPSLSFGALPSVSGQLPQRRASVPAALGGVPSTLGNLPSPAPARGPVTNAASALSLMPPTISDDLQLPLSLPEREPPLDAPVRLDDPVREIDPFGEAELPPPRSLRDTETKSSLLPAASAAGVVVRQEGGGTSYGEVNLGGEASDFALEAPAPPPPPARNEDMEFEAVPQEKGQPRISDSHKLSAGSPRSQAEEPEPRRRAGMKVFAGVCLLLASGGALALLPEVGPFGAHWIVDQARSGEYDVLLDETRRSVRQRFGRDTAPEATRAWDEADRARTTAKRAKPLAAHAAFVGYLRELRFGSAPEIHARAGVLLDEIDPKEEVAFLELARAARAATEGQLARARQALGAILARDRKNIDALVVSGEVELRARNIPAALEAWSAVEKLEQSPRALFGLARAEYWAGDVSRAEQHAKQTIEKNASHVGARILLARIASGRHGREAQAIETLESITQPSPAASSEELVDAYTLLGDIHLTRSRMSRADAAYTAALKLDPKAAGALGGLGEALFRAGRYSEAQARFEASVQADPDALAAKVGVAKSKLMLERLDESNSSLGKLRQAHPKSILVAYWHGRVLDALGEREAAAKAYRGAIEQKDESDPMLVEAYIALALLENQQGRAEAAIATLNAARKRFPSTPAIHRAVGDVALTQGRYGEAKAEFEQALALDTDDLAARFRLGSALRRDSKFDAAIKVFDQVAAVDAEFPGLALERGLLFEAAGKTEEALKQYETARAKAPNDPDLLLRVGCGYAAAGRTKDAEELLRKVLALRPTSAETQHCLGRALLAEGSRLADALRLLERAAELDPHRAEYFLYVGWAANEAGNMAKAQRALDEAIKLDQGLADAFWQRGVLRSRQNAVKDAVTDLTRALALRPTRYEAHAALADAYYDLGREPLALEQWAKAVEAKPENATWRFRYGKLLAANHKNELAKLHLGQALALAEQNSKGERWLWEAHHLLARVLGPRPESVPHWEAFLKLGPLDSPYRAEGKAVLERLGRPWTGS